MTTTHELRRFKAEIFQALAHPTRIAIVEALRNGEMSAGQLIEQLGLEQANASQHFAVLRSKQIVLNRKEGNQVFYSLRDPVLIEVLDILKRYFYSQLSETMSMLKEMQMEKKTYKKKSGAAPNDAADSGQKI
ncbi:MAG TPA: metalloregulator ArsR/SmtB family transcription factor [Bryobacteraceae bacterium]|nr:metalloregulator ArsR/SmtB family transcription factor [Bryobacteraceae bacterium]